MAKSVPRIIKTKYENHVQEFSQNIPKMLNTHALFCYQSRLYNRITVFGVIKWRNMSWGLLKWNMKIMYKSFYKIFLKYYNTHALFCYESRLYNRITVFDVMKWRNLSLGLLNWNINLSTIITFTKYP